MASGRKKDDIWKQYKELPSQSDAKCLKVACLKCNTEVQALEARMKKHFAKCSNVQIESEQEDELEIVETSTSTQGPTVLSINEATTSNLTGIDLRKKSEQTKSNTMNGFVVKTSKELKNELDLQCAKFIFSANLPFR